MIVKMNLEVEDKKYKVILLHNGTLQLFLGNDLIGYFYNMEELYKYFDIERVKKEKAKELIKEIHDNFSYSEMCKLFEQLVKEYE